MRHIAKDPVSEILLRRDAILEATGFAAEKLLRSSTWQEVVGEVMETLGRATGVSRTYIFRNSRDDRGSLLQDMIIEWNADGIASTWADPENHFLPYLPKYRHYVEELSAGRVMTMTASTAMPVDLRDLEDEGILSTAFVPVFTSDGWWGYLGFDDCVVERTWSKAELDALKVTATTLGAAISREQLDRDRTELEHRMQAMVERISAITYIEELEDGTKGLGNTTYVSPQIEAFTGYPAEDFIADPNLWLVITHPDDREKLRAVDDESTRSRERFELEYRLLTRDGRTVWVRDEAVLREGMEGGRQEWHGVMYDITSLRHALEREQRATAHLEELDDAKNTLLTAVSHDLRTPVTAILGLSLTLARDEGALREDEKREFAARIAASARKVNRIVSDLLDLDRISRGAVVLERNQAEVDQLVVRVLEESDVSSTHPVSLEVQHTVCSLDYGKVERIVENLLLNAAKHTPEGTRIHLTVEPKDGGALIAVEDEGPGVPDALRDTIFEPFTQGVTARNVGGVGVGLSVVARFTEMHGGRAWVENRPGGGASFKVFLPGS